LEQWLEHLPQRPAELQGNGSTSCWRGYEATWQLENDQLYLIGVRPCGGKPIGPAVFRQWFPADAPRRIAATWVTGFLDVVLGKLLRYEHMGYESIYDQDWLLRFEQGKLVGQQHFTNHGCQAFSLGAGEGFAKRLHQAINWREVPVQAAKAGKRVFIEFRPDSTGHRCQVLVRKRAGLPYDSLALRAARSVAAQDWGACYRFGRWLPTIWTAPISFTEDNRRRYKAARPAGSR
jgi:hypothetical protein